MSGVNGSVNCTAKGYIPWLSNEGSEILVPCYYTADVHGTIISPTDMTVYHKNIYSGWNMCTDIDKGIGEFKLIARDGLSHATFPAYSQNNLWYHYLTKPEALSGDRPRIMTLTDAAEHELWHHRLGYPGQKVT